MVDKMDKRSIRKLYLRKDPKDPYFRSSLTRLVAIGNPYLTFILHAMFRDVLPGIPCPAPFGILMKSGKTISYIVRRLMGRKVVLEAKSESEELYSNKWNESDYADIMKFLLNIERTNKRLLFVDQPFIRNVISKISEAEKARIIRFLEVSPLSISIMRTIRTENLTDTHLAVINLLKAKTMPYEEGFRYVHESNVDFKLLKRTFLKSTFSQIQKYFHILVDFFPEMMFGIRKPYSNRMQIFADPLSIPLKPRLLCVYIPACIYFIRRKSKSLSLVKNLDVLIKTIYIEKILSVSPRRYLLKKVIHQLILDTPILVKVIVMRRFPPNLIKKMVEYIPSFHLAYELSLKILSNDPSDSFYEELVEELLKKYPTKSNVKRFQACSHLFSNSLLERLKYLTETV
ncbi:uncharacterized protein Eint_040310 [Encephalitozoon intestinalis ATCC 50506]|uniref:Symplekin C-terminal domain-containing protein n=1 Tax=Encephalitozoon intestinalis (strain ATCC 50506) TaxID=876142 RepID=E0S6I7_ENCIT|nr:uncharacterized protein Eint_040310 [Encephalitozoon intestinalis ATCC 50506]ADM11322.1 hypothetical protein Eint_040310 [Encephalitozoon intestinalis ATCC 50506]UTX45008.1 hypothetical protein GPK93_04g05430 [Encephalitozoon intestinalis]